MKWIETKLDIDIPASHKDCGLWNFNWLVKDLEEATVEFVKHQDFCLFVSGPPGVGKTHFAVGVYKEIARTLGYIGADSVSFVMWPKFVEGLYDAMTDYMVTEYLMQWLLAKILILDDVSVRMKQFERDMLAKVVCDRYDKQDGLLITTNDNFEDLSNVLGLHELDRLGSRLVKVRIEGESKR